MKILLLLLFIFGLCEKQRFDNYHLISITLKTEQEKQAFESLYKNHQIDVWTNEGTLTIGSTSEILLSPQEFSILSNSKFEKNIQIINPNIQTNIDQEEKEKTLNTTFFEKYHRYEDIKNFMENLHSQYPDQTEIFTIGQTFEKRPVFGFKIKISRQPKHFWMSSLQHAREWISPMVTLYIMKRLLDEYHAGNQRVKKILDNIHIHFLPVNNVDGYEYTHTTNRLWRKNRRLNTPSTSIGVDINRNWPFQWNGPGSSADPGSDVYRGIFIFNLSKGPSPGSEVEVQNVIKYFNTTKFNGAVDFHSYRYPFC